MRLFITAMICLVLGYVLGIFMPKPIREHVTLDRIEAFYLVNEDGWTLDQVVPESENERQIFILKR